jgi:putative transposase
VILTFQYRLLPSTAQHRALEAILESQRELYNAALQERIEAYGKAGICRTYFDQCKALTEWRREDIDASALPVNVQRATLKRLHDAFQSFFRRVRSGGKPGFPRFRGRGRFASFGFAEFKGIALEGKRIAFDGIPGRIRIHVHRPLPPKATIKRCSFCKDVKGWSIAFNATVADGPVRPEQRRVGIDLGIVTFATLSDGETIPSLRAARRSERKLRIAQRSLSRKKPNSAGRVRSRNQLQRCYAAVSRQRANHLHQASARLIRDYDVIVVEALPVRALGMGPLAKDVRDASWGKFISMLRYKAEKAGARVIEVDPRNTSQDCSSCGTRVWKKLGDRQHECSYCGLSIDRDLNAARNILARAGAGPDLRNVAATACVQVETSNS